MQTYTIKHKDSDTIIFEAQSKSFKQTLETAIEQGINLAHADLRQQDLSNANLDDALLSNADLTGCNLTGANLSESNLYGATLNHTALYNTCLAYSDLRETSFNGATFAATDIASGQIDFAEFTDISCFTLNFAATRSMENCHFSNNAGDTTRFSNAPIMITGIIDTPIIITETAAFIGYTRVTKSRITRILKEGLTTDILRKNGTTQTEQNANKNTNA